jgi:phosphoesterase RecJ-like protein
MKTDIKDFSEKTLDLILNSKKVFITTHTNPDGDAIGSALGLKHIIKDNFDIDIQIIIDNSFPENLQFLKGSDEIKIYDDKFFSDFIAADLIFILDLNNPSRLKSLENPILNSNAKKIMIDHHIEPQDFTDLKYTDTNATSTGELIKRFADALNLRISKSAAEALYVAIMTDTGNFRHTRTNAQTFRIAADLLDSGADAVDIYDKVYNQNKLSVIKLLGYAYSHMEQYVNKKISVISIPEEIILEYNIEYGDIEGFAEKTLSVKDAQVGILLVKFPDKNEIKISLRSKSDFSVRNIAAKFNGGGHINAAGARIENASIEDAKKLLINEIKNIL